MNNREENNTLAYTVLLYKIAFTWDYTCSQPVIFTAFSACENGGDVSVANTYVTFSYKRR